MVRQEASHVRLLIVRDLEDVRESSSREDHLLACAFGIKNGAIGVDLGCTDGRDERTARWEGRIEPSCINSLGTYKLIKSITK